MDTIVQDCAIWSFSSGGNNTKKQQQEQKQTHFMTRAYDQGLGTSKN